jgi:hypothetical protein
MKERLPAEVRIFFETKIMSMMMSLGDDVAPVLE